MPRGRSVLGKQDAAQAHVISRNQSVGQMVTQIEQAYEMVENSSEPKFVPVNRSAREMKLLYSQHVRETK